MKKAKLMLGVTALSAALLGTGYAAMTDTVNIGGTVSTANFCVQFKDQPNPESEAAKNPENYEITEATAKLEGVTGETGNSHTITFNAENVKADVPLTYSTTIENLSSIKAQFKGATVTASKVDGGTESTTYPANKVNLTVTINKDAGLDKEIVYTGTLAGISTDNSVENLILAANDQKDKGDDEVPVEFKIEVQADADEADATETKSIGFDLTFNWAQTQGTASN